MARLFTEDEVRRMIAEAIAPLKARIADLEAEISRLRKNSTTSSKPPSSDIVKPPRPKSAGGKRGKRRGGGQQGHRRHTRPPFPPEQVDETWLYEWTAVPPGWKALEQFSILQQVELVEKPYTVSEHRARLYENLRTGQMLAASLPGDVRRAGLLGPRLTALVGYQKGACHMSVETIRRFLRDVFHLPISHGQVMKTVRKVSAALGPCHEELQKALPQQTAMGIDETGHHERGHGLWSWCFHVPGQEHFTWFHIDPSRGSKVLKRYLGKAFEGIIGCDYFSAYRKYMGDFNVAVQFCLAHLIRDVKFLTTLADAATAAYGQKLLDGLREMFHVIHRREQLDAAEFAQALQKTRDELLAAGQQAPPTREAQNLAERFHRHGAAYFCFITTPGIEPTNNLAEQAIRFVVLDRLVTQGTRSVRGRRWCERIWTAVATCAQQGRSVVEYLRDTLDAHRRGQATPSLLPAGL